MADLLTSGATTGPTVSDRARENRFFVRRLLAERQPDFAAALEEALAEVVLAEAARAETAWAETAVAGAALAGAALAEASRREACFQGRPGARFVSF